MSTFNGFPPSALDWFLGISLDNSKAYFEGNRAAYEGQVRGPFTALLTELSQEFGGTPKVFRPNRDIRFSADKRPYKTNVSGYLAEIQIYLDLSADGLMAATGYYQMAKDQLERYRAALTTDDDAPSQAAALRLIVEILHAQGMPVEGESLKSAPKGYARDHPEIDLLRRKSLVISATLPFENTSDPIQVVNLATAVWKAGSGLNAWLAQHVGPSTLEW